MQFTKMILAAAAAVSVAAYSNDTIVWVTNTVTELTTYCPAGATLTVGPSTIVNTKTVGVTVTVPCPGGCVHSYPVTTYAPTTPPAPTVAPTKPANVTTTPPKTTPVFTGAAGHFVAGSAAGLAGLLGMAAYIL